LKKGEETKGPFVFWAKRRNFGMARRPLEANGKEKGTNRKGGCGPNRAR